MNKKVFTHRAVYLQSLLALSIAATLPAMAEPGATLEEVVVTAEHKEASVQDTQISISALSAQDIEDLGISNSTDLGYFAPNVTINSYQGGRSGVAVNMRGMAQNETIVTFDPAVGVYIDDVLISKNVGAMLDVVDMERIEILRGPQGTLYGRNTMGGTVNYVTKKPIDEFEAKIGATFGKYNQRDLKGVVNLPVTDSLAVRLSAASIERDGLIDVEKPAGFVSTPESELETKDRQAALLHVRFEPTDNLSLLYSYDLTRIDEIPTTPFVTGTSPTDGVGAIIQPFAVGYRTDRPSSISVDHPHQAKTDVDGHSLHVDWALSDTLTFKSITAYRDMENISFADSDGSPFSFLATDDTQTTEQFTQEFRLTGSVSDIDFTTGVFYMDEQGDVLSGLEVLGETGFIFTEDDAHFENKNWAVYGQGSYPITDKLLLTIGGRYTQEDREMSKVFRLFSQAASGPLNVAYPHVRAETLAVPFPNAQGDFDNFSWLVSASYDWNETMMTYFKVSTGYQSGGFNIRDTNPATFAEGFDEETLLAYELGFKSEFNERIRLNAAFWYSDYDDKRVNNFNAQTLTNVVRNAGVVEIYGWEIELLAQLSEHWQLGASWGYTQPKFVEYDSTQEDPNNPGQVIPVDLSDVTNFPYTPENTAGVNLSYEKQLAMGLLRARIDWAYKDEYNFLAPQPERNYQGAYDIWNARITLDDIAGPGDTTVRVSAWGKNLTDEGYYHNGVSVYSSFGFDFNMYGEPRSYGIDLEMNF